jgi:aerobic-type carbon monoxide dehydrogenase small subunit (CoxS/CutS family)
MELHVKINGRAFVKNVDEHRTLLHFLREECGLTGTKEGCGAGECGACTVLLNGEAVNSCMVLACEAEGAEIETIEGEAEEGKLSPLQEAFHRNHAVQCGFCTPGMILSIKALLRKNSRPTELEIKEAIEGNFCRCTGYQQIVEAVLDVTGQKKKEELTYV